MKKPMHLETTLSKVLDAMLRNEPITVGSYVGGDKRIVMSAGKTIIMAWVLPLGAFYPFSTRSVSPEKAMDMIKKNWEARIEEA